VIPIDWTALAQEIGTLYFKDGGRVESGGTVAGRKAIAQILGADVLRSAVDHYVTYAPGSELSRSVLILLKPDIAAERCMEILRTAEETETQAAAVELLRNISDRRVLNWLPEIISHAEPRVRLWAVGIIDQLLIMQNEIEFEDAMPFITNLLNDKDHNVQKQAEELMAMIKEEYP
jgi:HEAT repeat protein